MDWSETLSEIDRIANTRLFEVGGRSVTPASLLIGVLIIVVAFVCSELVQRAIVRALKRRGVEPEHGAGALGRLLHYAIVVIGVMVALQTTGIEIGALFAAGAVFAVGLGFAMQNIAQNFVSGVILLVERTIGPGDILELEGSPVKVVQMGIRATLVRTLNEEIMIVPNSTIVQSTVKSYTIKDSLYRLRVMVGVTYSSDMDLVERTLKEVVADVEWRHERSPEVILRDFADSSVNWEVSVWMTDPWRAQAMRGEVRKAIWNAFKRENITIAFPQLDIHFDEPIEKAIVHSRSAA